MYIDRFINDKYIALLCYCININRRNSIIVDLKYDIRNSTLLLYKVSKKMKFNGYLREFLSKLRKSSKFISGTNIYIKRLKRERAFFFRYIDKTKLLTIQKRKVKIQFKKNLNDKLKAFKAKQKIVELRRFKKVFRSSYNFINTNTNLHERFPKFKLLRFIIQKLLHNQVLGNVSLLGGFLDLNLHPLFLRRFKYHFLLDIGNVRRMLRKSINFNNFNYFFVSEFFPKLKKCGRYILALNGLMKKSRFSYYMYLRGLRNFKNFLTLNFHVKHLSKFKNYLSNSVNINYINISFKLKPSKYSPYRRWRRVRRYFRKFKRINFLSFLNIAFLKLVNFLFLYWFNNFLILFKIKSKGTILSNWFKSIGFVFKKYIWRKKPRNYYLSFNTINNFVFLNYKNRLIKLI